MTEGRGPGYTRERLAAVAAHSRSEVDMLRSLGQPLGSGPLRYLRQRLRHYFIDTAHFVDEPLPGRPRVRYTREVLDTAAPRCRSLRELMEFLGVPPYGSAYGYLKRRLAHFGVDTSHFVRSTHHGTSRASHGQAIEDGELRQAVSESRTMAQTLRVLGLDDTTAQRRRVRRAMQEYGIRDSHFVGQGHNRGQRSPRRLGADEILRVRSSGSPRARRQHLDRALREKGVPYRCLACGQGDRWRGRRLVLEIDHLNGDPLDNRRANLRYLCPSCHSQTPTYSRRGPRRGYSHPVPGCCPVE